MRARRAGISTALVAGILVVIVVVAGVGYYEFASTGTPPTATSQPPSSTSRSTTYSTTSSTVPPTSSSSASSSSTVSSTSSASTSSTTSSRTSSSTSSTSTTAASSSLTKGTGTLIETFTPPTPIFASSMFLNYTLNIQTLGGTPEMLSLSMSGPSGFALTINPSQVTVTAASGPVQVAVSGIVAQSVPSGTYAVNITATGGGAFYTESLNVQVAKYLVVTIGTAFVPPNITVPVGSTVTWLRLNGQLSNYDDGKHNMDFGSAGIPISSNLLQYDSWSYTFTKAGTYPYICDFHPDMKGTITVTG